MTLNDGRRKALIVTLTFQCHSVLLPVKTRVKVNTSTAYSSLHTRKVTYITIHMDILLVLEVKMA